ncbi:MAG: efflux RND transporter periplasmic adaptor subunit [Bacteroidota bacterium]
MKNSFRLFFIPLLILVIAGIVFYPKISPLLMNGGDSEEVISPQGPRALNVEALVMEPIRLVEVINSSGTLIPDEEVELSFETSGMIVDIDFEEGTRVKRGEMLAKINDRPLQAQLLKLQAQKKLAEEREFRQRSLLSRDAISQESYDQVVTDLQSIEADIMLVQARIAETELRAPFDGVVGLRHVSEGTYVNANTRIALLIKNDPLKIEFAIPERYSGEISPGYPLRFFLDGIKDTLKANIYAIEPKVDTRTRNIVVRAMYSNPGERIKPGRFVSIQLDLAEVDDALAIPTEALIPEMDGDRVFVYRHGKAHSLEVTTGLRTEDMIQITKGLQPGDTLITTGILQLREGIPLVLDTIQ